MKTPTRLVAITVLWCLLAISLPVISDPTDDEGSSSPSRGDPLFFNTPKMETGDYWVLVRDAEHIALDESDDKKATYFYHDEKKFTVTGTESVTTSAGTFQCYKMDLTGDVRASGDGVRTVAGIKVNFHFDLEAPLTGEIWVRISDLAFVKVHIEADGYAETNTVLGTIHQYQNLFMEYEPPEKTFGFPMLPGSIDTVINDVHVTGVINIEGQTNGDEPVDEYHHIETERKISSATSGISIPSANYDNGQPYPLAGTSFDCWTITNTDKGGYHDDGDSIDPPSGGTSITHFSPEVGFYVKQEVRNQWTAWAGGDEYTVQSTEVLAEYSYRSEVPVILETHGDAILNDGVHQGNITVKVSDDDGLLDIGEVFIDLSSLGMGDHSAMYDDGTHGDYEANNGIYTIGGISSTTSPLEYYLPVTVRDQSGNEATDNVRLRVVDFRDLPPLIINGMIYPGMINNDETETALLTVQIEDDNGIDAVTADLSPIGGVKDSPLYDDGTHGDVEPDDLVYSREVTASPNCTGGAKLLKVDVKDTENNLMSSLITLMIVEWNKAPEIIPYDTEIVKNDGEDATLISVGVSDNEDNLEKVFVDLSEIGGEENAPMYDDGSHGDAVREDGIFSLTITVWKNYSFSLLSLVITAVDTAGLKAEAGLFVDIECVGSPPVLSNAVVTSDVENDGEDVARIMVDYYDRDNNINWIMIDLSAIGIKVPKGMVLEDGQATIDLTVNPEIEPGMYNLTITAMDLDWKTATMQVSLVVVAISEEEDHTDSDGDGIPNWWEIRYGMNPKDPRDAKEDWNSNGRTNLEEFSRKKNPLISGSDLVFLDSDFDGMPDWWENRYDLDPFNSNDGAWDANRNGIPNREEYDNGTNPKYLSLAGQTKMYEGIEQTTVSEKELNKTMDNLLLIMLINFLFLVFSIILFLLERRWRKRNIIEGGSLGQKDMVELEARLQKKLDEQNELIKDLIDVVNEASLIREKGRKRSLAVVEPAYMKPATLNNRRLMK